MARRAYPKPILPPNPVGRPSIYSAELAAAICTGIAEGKSLVKVLEGIEGAPIYWTVTRWLQENEEFRANYARAREDSADYDADWMRDIVTKTLDGGYEPNAARVAVDALKWSAGKRKPKVYGDKQAVEHSLTASLESLVAGSLGKTAGD